MTLPEFDLSGQVALVTGAGRGIAGGGWRVSSQRPARRCLSRRHDRPRRRGRDVAAVLAAFGRIDVLVNGVGDAIAKPLVPLPDRSEHAAGPLTDEELDLTLALNLTSALLCCRAVGPQLLERRSGAVVNIRSFTGARAGAGLTVYTAGKAGLIGFTRALALEWAPYGVRVNSVAPGTFPDPVTQGEDGYRRSVEGARERVPLGRVGELREVGLLSLYLASPAAAYMTGQTLFLDGGATL